MSLKWFRLLPLLSMLTHRKVFYCDHSVLSHRLICA